MADAELADRTGPPGNVLGLRVMAAGGGDGSPVEASRMPGTGGADPDRAPGESMQESEQTVMSWLRANAGRYDLDPFFHGARSPLRHPPRQRCRPHPARYDSCNESRRSGPALVRAPGRNFGPGRNVGDVK